MGKGLHQQKLQSIIGSPDSFSEATVHSNSRGGSYQSAHITGLCRLHMGCWSGCTVCMACKYVRRVKGKRNEPCFVNVADTARVGKLRCCQDAAQVQPSIQQANKLVQADDGVSNRGVVS